MQLEKLSEQEKLDLQRMLTGPGWRIFLRHLLRDRSLFAKNAAFAAQNYQEVLVNRTKARYIDHFIEKVYNATGNTAPLDRDL